MEKKIFFLFAIACVSCNNFVNDDDSKSHVIIDENKVEISYYHPSNGIVDKPDTLTFFVDYQIKTTEPEYDGFEAWIVKGNENDKEIIKRKSLILRNGNFPYSIIMPPGYSSYFNGTTNYSVRIQRILNGKYTMLAISNDLLFTVKY